MFDLNVERDQQTFKEVTNVHGHFTSVENLVEIIRFYNATCNKSFSMTLVKIAPKHKNYNQKKSLDYRVDMVTGHQQVPGLGCHFLVNLILRKPKRTLKDPL